MKIVGIAGKAGSGKDTVADFLVERHGYTKLSWAGPLKAAMAAMGLKEPNNRDDKEKPVPGFSFTWREAAQKLGTEWGRELDPDIWVKMVGMRMRRGTDLVVVSDCRFENETAKIRELGGVMLFMAGRQANLGTSSGHVSEQVPMFYPNTDHDFLIDNSKLFSYTEEQVLEALGLEKK